MFYSSRLMTSLTFVALAATASACGSAARDAKTSQASSNSISIIPADDGSGTGTGTGSISIVPTFATGFSLNTVTNNQVEMTNPITTDTILKVQVKPGLAGRISIPSGTYSNFSANYGCVSYNVSLMSEVPKLNSSGQIQRDANGNIITEFVQNGMPISTQTLKVDDGSGTRPTYDQCPNAPTSVVIDFSNRLTPGHMRTKIKVEAPRYDFYCQQYKYCSANIYFSYYYYQWIIPSGCSIDFVNANQSFYCPLKTVYKTHTVTGTLDVETNGSTFGN